MLLNRSFSFGVASLLLVLAACEAPTANPVSPPAATGLQGKVTTFAGSGTWGWLDGAAVDAQFWSPEGLATDGTSLFVADRQTYRIRQISLATGVVSTLAGGDNPGFVDDTGPQARFNTLMGIATDGTSVFVSEWQQNRIRQINIASGEVTTLAGSMTGDSGSANGSYSGASFYFPRGLATDGTYVYVADLGNSCIRRIKISDKTVETLAGSTQGATNGPASTALFNQLEGLALVGTDLYIADTGNHLIRKLALDTMIVTTVAGGVGTAGTSDGKGILARFNQPVQVTSDGSNLYVTDQGSHSIRQIVLATQEVTTLAGGTKGFANGTKGAAKFDTPWGITATGGKVYVADYNHVIRKVE